MTREIVPKAEPRNPEPFYLCYKCLKAVLKSNPKTLEEYRLQIAANIFLEDRVRETECPLCQRNNRDR